MIPIAPASNQKPYQPIEILKTKRTRSKRSCDFCRQKKTRCDGSLRQPCTKCQQAQVDCVYLTKQKKRGPQGGSYVEMLENRLKRMEELLQNLAKNKQLGLEDIEDDEEEEEEEEQVDENDVPNGLACPMMTGLSPEIEALQQQMNGLTVKDYQRTRYVGSSSGMHLVDRDILMSKRKIRFLAEPSWFIQKVNNDQEEHVIMKTKEIQRPLAVQLNEPVPERAKVLEDITLMTAEIADIFVHKYFCQLHADCPIINKIEYLEQYYFHNPSSPDKYLTYALVFIGSMVATERDVEGKLTQIEFATMRKQLKEKAYQIISILHKRPLISTIQALLTLSMYIEDESDNDDEDMSYWFITGMAIRLAQDLGLHLDCSSWNIPPQEIELRRRLWYSCYIVDRWVSAQLGRPISIIDDEFDVKLPSPYELDSSTPRTKAQIIPPLLLEAYAAVDQNTSLYDGFRRFIGITELLGQVLVALYSTKNRHKRSKEAINDLECSLDVWKQSVLKDGFLRSEDTESTPVFQIFYYTVLIFIYRPFITAETEDTELAFRALSICTSAAYRVLHAAEISSGCTLANAPWSPLTYCIFQAAIIFLHNARGENELLRKEGQEALDRCIRLYTCEPCLYRTRTVKVLIAIASAYCVSPKEISYSPDSSPSPASNAHQSITITRESLPSIPDDLVYPNHSAAALVVNNSSLNSTRPEDMFNFSLNSVGFFKRSLSDNNKAGLSQVQQQQQQQQQQLLNHPLEFQSDLFTSNHVNLLQDFDLSSLKSDVPLWDMPSGINWNEWEGFMKHGSNVCIVGTMTSQGVCPEPTCMSPEAIGLSGSNSSDSSSSNAGLIGGLVGGLVGGGALLGCLGYIFIRHKQKKNAIPLALKRAVVNNSSKRNMTPRQQEEMMHSSQQSRVTSGVIPVTFVPESQSTEDNRHASVSTFASSQHVSRRASVESNSEQQQKATVIQATQVIRAKPQIMRVNTVKVHDGLNRSASFKKTLKPEKTDDPFDDKNKAAASPTSSKEKVTAGESSKGEGEITIVWNGS
ncbi:hypothetical protein G6F61_002491 [Rhizopus arrhizus]|nr:hypothetical protein G6F61_002491 [Rhizopus arrhizus]